jgi:hypothetical protein
MFGSCKAWQEKSKTKNSGAKETYKLQGDVA